MIELLAFNGYLFWCFLGCTVSYALLSFDSPLRSGLSLHIEERKKYRFMEILDLSKLVGAFGLAPATYLLFPFHLPSAAATAQSSNPARTIRLSTYLLSTYLLSHARQSFQMENSQHPRRRNRSSNISQEHVTGPPLPAPPETPSEKSKEVATGFTDIYGAFSPRRAGLISSSTVTWFTQSVR